MIDNGNKRKPLNAAAAFLKKNQWLHRIYKPKTFISFSNHKAFTNEAGGDFADRTFARLLSRRAELRGRLQDCVRQR